MPSEPSADQPTVPRWRDAGVTANRAASETDPEERQSREESGGFRSPPGSITRRVTRLSSPGATTGSMPKARGYDEECRRSSIGTDPRADSSDGFLRGRERPATASGQSANPRESSGADGSRPRCSERDIPRTTAHRSTAPPAHSTPPQGRG